MYFWLFTLFWVLSSVQAEELPKANAEIIVEAHRNIEIYVAPAILVNNAPELYDVNIDDLAIFGYASIHSKLAKVPGKYGYVNANDSVMVYNNDTIEYVWPNCNYRLDHKKCSMENGHWWLETKVTVEDKQIVIAMYIYDEYAQIRSTGRVTSDYSISYIQRQKTTTSTSRDRVTISGGTNSPNCSGASCSGGSYSGPMETGRETTVEDLPPAKIEVKPGLMNKHIHQTSLRAWVGLKIE